MHPSAESVIAAKIISKKSAALGFPVAPGTQSHGTPSIAPNAQACAAVPAWRAPAQRTQRADRRLGDFQDCWSPANAQARFWVHPSLNVERPVSGSSLSRLCFRLLI